MLSFIQLLSQYSWTFTIIITTTTTIIIITASCCWPFYTNHRLHICIIHEPPRRLSCKWWLCCACTRIFSSSSAASSLFWAEPTLLTQLVDAVYSLPFVLVSILLLCCLLRYGLRDMRNALFTVERYGNVVRWFSLPPVLAFVLGNSRWTVGIVLSLRNWPIKCLQ